ncbi:unnamed protein product [Closterium sp. Yama58-4]|nr:unnamed protein product [Closterium sp. Yama58-4]
MFPALDMVAILLDAAATQARTAPDALVLLDQARTVLTAWQTDQQGLKEEDKGRGGKNQPGKQHHHQQHQEREEDSSNNLNSVQWATAERLLQRLEAIQNQDPTTPLPSLLAAVQPHLSPSPGLSGSAGVRRGPKARAVMALQQVVADCEAGTAQFVSEVLWAPRLGSGGDGATAGGGRLRGGHGTVSETCLKYGYAFLLRFMILRGKSSGNDVAAALLRILKGNDVAAALLRILKGNDVAAALLRILKGNDVAAAGGGGLRDRHITVCQ